MRTIEWTGQFKRDYKREAKGRYRATLDAELCPVIGFWAYDQVRITEIMGCSAT